MSKKEARSFLRKQAGNVWVAIQELTMEELQEVKLIIDGYSTTNCWYIEYNMKDSFLKLINDRIADIEGQQKESRRTEI